MFTLVAFSESLDPAAVYVNHAGVPDQHVAVNGDYIYIPEFAAFLMGAWCGADITVAPGAYLQSPSLLAMAPYHIDPVDVAIAPVNHDAVHLHPESPFALKAMEGLEALIQCNPGAATVNALVAFLSDGPITKVTGEIIKLRFTTGITETASVWSNGAITLTDNLPVGKYAIVGAKMYGTSGVAFRFVLPGGFHRPGMIATPTVNNQVHPLSRNGGLGVWGEFDSRVLPTIDWLGSATSGTAQVGVMDLIKVG
jgi:hypothetical protein